MKMICLAAASLSLLALAACARRENLSPMPSISEEERTTLESRVDCRTAQHDISVLESEKASVGRQALAGVRSVVPFAAAAGILMGDYQDRTRVATGQYNRDIEAKIAEIRRRCGIR